MLKKYRYLIPLGMLLAAAVLSFRYLRVPVTLRIDGQAQSMVTTVFATVGDALRAANIPVRAEDSLTPGASTRLLSATTIQLDRARPVSVIYHGVPLPLITSERRPEKLLAQTGVPLTEQDQLFLDGQRVLPGQDLPPAEQYSLTVRPAVTLTLDENGKKRVLQSAAPTLIQALWDAGVRLNPGDQLSLPPETPLAAPLEVTLRRAVPLTVQLKDSNLRIRTSAATVGAALAEAGMPLQGLDYSDPAEDQPVKPGGTVRVVRVREEITLKQTVIPFKSEYKSDANTDLDTRSIIAPGKLGLKVSRERVRYEDGQEVSRQTESEWTASEPVNQVVGLGTRAVVKKLDTSGGQIEYYRAVNVYATSYSPCRQGMNKCSKSTSSGIPLRKGIIAVTLPWYRQFAGQQVYIPGYGVGVIADVGGGIPGTDWVDLGYDEDNFENWHQNVTMYFLTPIPANVPWNLP